MWASGFARILLAMPGRRALGAVLAAIGCATALAASAPGAGAYIYWGNLQAQTIGRAENDGSGANPGFIQTGVQPNAVAVDAGHIYWVNAGGDSIGRANIDGSAVDNNFITGIKQPDGIAVNESSVFWSTIPGPIGRADISGSNVNKAFITAAGEPCGLAVDSGHLWWADARLSESVIGRAGLDGNFVQAEYAEIGTAFPCGVAVNSANVYWSDFGFFAGGSLIGRVDVATGKSVDQSFIAGASAPCGIALDASSHLYWANAGTDTIARANSDGTAVNQSFVQTGTSGEGGICGVAVDSLATPPPPTAKGSDSTPPETRITSGPGHKLARGIARFSFAASEPASSFACRLDHGRTRPCRSPKRYRKLKPGRHTFSVWATDASGNRDATPARRNFRVPRG
jgi:virginiamycin B lyase